MNDSFKVFSALSEEFVSPLFPRGGEEVKVSIAFTEKPEWVAVKCMSEIGLNHHEVLHEDGFFNGAYKYSAMIKAISDERPFRYFFCFGCQGKSYYYSKKGISRNCPRNEDRFALAVDLEAPSWIASSTCYQIFPDRFNRGDESVGAKAGMYAFDGGIVTTPEFDSIPRPYPESKCLDFYNGDLKGIEQKLDYIESLGFDTLYLNPINSSMTVHRFDSTDFFSVDEKLGGDEAYESLCKKVHERGMRIIVDISINHTSSAHPWLLKAKNDFESEERGFYYFYDDGRVRLWQGVPTLCQLNYNSQKLRELIYRGKESALRKYLRPPFNQDGWRLDVAPELGRSDKDQLCQEVWREVRSALHQERKDLYLVGEDWDDASDYCKGDMWDATMNYFGSGRVIRSWLGERDRFLSSGWGHSPEREEAWDAFETVEALKDGYDAYSSQMVFFQMNLFDSHDTPRLHNNRELVSEDSYLGGLIVLYMLPGMPNVYYGDEIWLDGELGSVEASRYPMCWDESKWNKRVQMMHKSLAAIRKDKSFGYSSFRLFALDSDAFALERLQDGKAYIAIVNKGESRRVVLDSSFLPVATPLVVVGEGDVSIEEGTIVINLHSGKSLVFEL